MKGIATGGGSYRKTALEDRGRPARGLTFWRVVSYATLLSVIPAAVWGAELDQPKLPPAHLIVDRMAAARAVNQARLRPYTVVRRYTLFSKDNVDPKSEVTAEIRFTPPNLKTYQIVERTGSGLGEKLVRNMLDGETNIVKDYRSTDISLDNYAFEIIGRAEGSCDGCYIIDLFPRRKESTLLLGRMWIDSDSYLLRRMQAKPAKSPSWWLRDIRLQFLYSDVVGMWLQTSSEFTTNVRLFGEYRMTSRDVSYQNDECATNGSTDPNGAAIVRSQSNCAEEVGPFE